MTSTHADDALIGYTGFVGSILAAEAAYGAMFNSRNIDDIRGKQFDRIVCAGVPAVKWWANKEPEADLAGIEKLKSALANVRARQFVLISTVDVYPTPIGLTETDETDMDIAQPYGKHRRALEKWIVERFDDAVIIRLPALFGEGLKKNVIFDLMTGNMTDKINPNGRFQWYPMRRFPADLGTILESGLKLVNIAVEPVTTREIRDRFFPDVAIGPDDLPPVTYDIRTDHPRLLGNDGLYHLTRDAVFDEFAKFLRGAAR